ncbi:MAG: outer membrane receptor protein involved in Fe transport [Cognaticolwellia sp.]|jgi:outer membrane receptor protein involved in Fe transport
MKKQNKFRLSLLTVYIVISTGVFAVEENTDLSSISLEDLINIEVTSASKIAIKISKAPAVITAYSRDHINDYGFEVINDLLFTLPSFSPSQDYDRPTVSSRGNFDSWNNNHILHLVDGVPMNDNLYGSAYTWFTPLFTTKTMEVIRGPGSALYGSNATNGVVQMNTLKASDLDKSIYVKFSLSGTDNTARREFMTGSVSGGYDFIMAYSYHETDGNQYSTYDGSGRLSGSMLSDGSPEAIKYTSRDNRDDSYLWAKLSVGDNWQIQYHRQEWDFDTGHGWVFWVPDFDEEMNESRNILSVKYNSELTEQWSQEYVVRYQKHDITWNQRYYPVDAFDGFYTDGMWEYLDTEAEDVFARAQFTYSFSDDSHATFLAGFEIDRFTYEGDNEHFSNVNMLSFAPEGAVLPQGAWLDYIKDEPVINSAFYAQLTTGNWIHEDFQVTVGVRSDNISVDYNEVYGTDVTDPNTPFDYVLADRDEPRPAKSKNFSKVSPRFAGVWNASENLVLKLMWGKAFRAPTPTEMAGAHTFSLASNIGQLEPELMTTTEFQFDWTLDLNHVVRTNIYSTKFENQIAYSTANTNLSTNIYSTENLGYEFEFIGNHGDWNWFTNISSVFRQGETIQAFFDENLTIPEFSEHDSDIKWVPSVRANAGISYAMDDFNLALIMHYQGEVERRSSDSDLIPDTAGYCGDPVYDLLPLGVCVPDNFNLDKHRGNTIDSSLIFDANVIYEFKEGFKLILKIKNLFDEKTSFIKTGPFPFDFQRQGRHVMLSLETEI